MAERQFVAVTFNKSRRLPLQLFCLPIILLALISCQGKRPNNLGLNTDGGLFPCPDKPNCISSDDEKSEHYVEPIAIHSNKETAYKKLHNIIATTKGSKIIKSEENYLYAEFTSSVFKFVDDVEFHFSRDDKNIFIRSASRLGKHDFGVNRDRIKKIRFRFQQNDYQK